MANIVELIQQAIPSLVDLRHDLHAHPELCFEEHETARRVLEQLEPLANLEIRTGVAGTGIVATLNADRPGPCVALRAELDALPIEEQTGLPYASRRPGRMHACGHDGHLTCLVGAARVLSQIADQLPGKVKFIFQPAEEGGAGADLMCREGVLDDPPVDAIFALHGWPELDLGTVGIRPGEMMASMDKWTMTVHGVSGHAAFPHLCVDPIVAAAQVTTALQTVASRTANPLESVVLTVAMFHAGTASNIIPPSAELAGTIRALDSTLRDRAIAQFQHIATQTASALGARAEIAFAQGYPVLKNDPTTTALIHQIAQEVVAPDNVQMPIPPTMGSEDFAFYAQQVPATFWLLGVGDPPPPPPPPGPPPPPPFPPPPPPKGPPTHLRLPRRRATNRHPHALPNRPPLPHRPLTEPRQRFRPVLP